MISQGPLPVLRLLAFSTILVGAMVVGGGPEEAHQVLITRQDRAYTFWADEQTDGRRVYTARLNGVWGFPTLYETGKLTDEEWSLLTQLQPFQKLPEAPPPQINGPAEVRGDLRRGKYHMVVRYADWWALSNTPVSWCYYKMIHDQKFPPQ